MHERAEGGAAGDAGAGRAQRSRRPPARFELDLRPAELRLERRGRRVEAEVAAGRRGGRDAEAEAGSGDEGGGAHEEAESSEHEASGSAARARAGRKPGRKKKVDAGEEEGMQVDVSGADPDTFRWGPHASA